MPQRRGLERLFVCDDRQVAVQALFFADVARVSAVLLGPTVRSRRRQTLVRRPRRGCCGSSRHGLRAEALEERAPDLRGIVDLLEDLVVSAHGGADLRGRAVRRVDVGVHLLQKERDPLLGILLRHRDRWFLPNSEGKQARERCLKQGVYSDGMLN